ncbi:putative protein kinase RLK-Pelle-DLSV family [Rosa chinensis]|uniref:Serine-threonine/tyrosine-protein kinase catalytic domain-containing protein n=1 Tax=Rosa chinensis TaxID=74649 RepID=A0A2P6S5L8_ROSCH|nr:putative protein kinase RLK-Pelle-DLSV family [Rosa chinensis]
MLGTLHDGREIAIKRFFITGKTQTQEVYNEIHIISKAQHKKLVRFLGCCFTNISCFLICEFLANRSLDLILFVKLLSYSIEGPESLLVGYMAPEYLVQGQLIIEKAYVYSFRVLVLEIVSGMKNSTFKQADTDFDSLLHKVWKHYRSNELADVVDPCLRDHELPAKEVSNVLQIGLLCTQASVALRPSMAEVFLMLTANKESDIPIPNQPPFLNATTLEQASSIRSNSANSFVSNTLRVCLDKGKNGGI